MPYALCLMPYALCPRRWRGLFGVSDAAIRYCLVPLPYAYCLEPCPSELGWGLRCSHQVALLVQKYVLTSTKVPILTQVCPADAASSSGNVARREYQADFVRGRLFFCRYSGVV
jgi:hypothetical protein